MKTKTTTNVRARHSSAADPTSSEGTPVHQDPDLDQQEPVLYPDLEGFIPEAYFTIQDPPAYGKQSRLSAEHPHTEIEEDGSSDTASPDG